MKLKTPVTILVGFAVACLLSFGAMGAMITGLDLPVRNMEYLYRAWAIAALAGCLLSLVKGGQIPTLILTVLGMWYLWEYHYLSLPLRALITRLSWIYDSAYGWGVLEFAGVNWQVISLDLPLGVFGCLIALTAAEAMVWGRGLIAPVGLAIMPLTASLIVTNTVPDPVWLFLLIFGIIQLVLTATVRRQNPHQGAKLVILTTLPVALLMSALFMAYPKDTYVNRSKEQLDAAVNWWYSLNLFGGDSTGLISQTPAGPGSTATSNLRRVGPRNIRDYPVMTVTSELGGTIYLRGQDFDDYDGGAWSSTALRSEKLEPPGGRRSTVTVKTLRPMNLIYIPYHPADSQTIIGGRVENTDDLTEYTYDMVATADKYLSSGTITGTTIDLGQAIIIDIDGEIIQGEDAEEIISEEFAAAVDGAIAGVGDPNEVSYADLKFNYTLLTEETLAWAEPYVERIFRANGISADSVRYFSDTAKAGFIADHVRASALYDTDTSRMDLSYDDFAQWFLEESATGYCVHFATATAVLLRAAGIPARYVTGYMVSCEAGEATTVTADMAHAWVEYYDGGVWQVLEATPPDLGQEETESETEIQVTEPPTEAPTDPEDTTRPDLPRPGDQTGTKLNLKPLWTALKWLAGFAAAVFVFFGQYRFRRRRKPAASPNAKALGLWQDVARICRFTKQESPEALLTLAEKAKFSQHTLTREELAELEDWLAEAKAELKQKPWYLRLVYQYVLALW